MEAIAASLRFRVHLVYSGWSGQGPGWARGNAFRGRHLLSAQELVGCLTDSAGEENFLTLVKSLNGFFALVQEDQGSLRLAVDPLRSQPLFFGCNDTTAWVSDDAYWVRDQLGEVLFETVAAEEFAASGFVSGMDTLYSCVKQVQAGDVLFLRPTAEGWNICVHPYHRYRHRNTEEYSSQELAPRFEDVLNNIFTRLVKVANGRTIVIPLSGGDDSRIVALMLKRLSYPHLLAFSYGLPGNRESRISKDVAKVLGIPWHFVPYSNETWYRWHRSFERKTYERMADNLCTLPHTQDWPAVGELQKTGEIPPEAVFVPGHSADLLAGSRSARIPQFYRPGAAVVDAIPMILSMNYDLQNGWSRQEEWIPRFLDRITRTLDPLASYNSAAEALEAWEVQERQAKKIINSVRAYEFWGYLWWLPLWDGEFISFWARVPLFDRLHQSFYRRFVKDLYKNVTCLPQEKEPTRDWRIFHQTIRRFVRTFPPSATLLSLLKRSGIWRKAAYDKDPLASFGIVSRDLFLHRYTGCQSSASFEALERLGRLCLDGSFNDPE
ncbi:MAG: asparagine synthase C-terminal domain-containing protein [bacterium]